MKHKFYFLAVLLLCCFSAKAQTIFWSISGQSNPEPGTTHTYTAGFSSNPGSVSMNWQVTGGTINGSTVNCGTTCRSISITWNNNLTSGEVRATPGNGSNTFSPSSNAMAVTPSIPLHFVTNINSTLTVSFNTAPGELPEVNAIGSGGCGGTFTYQWQRSPNQITWIDAGTATTNHSLLNFNPGNLTQNEYFRIRAVCFSQTAFTNALLVKVLNTLDPGTITYSQNINPWVLPAPLKGNAAKGEQGIITYQWQESSDASNWADVSGATAKDYQPPLTFSTKYYRRRATSTNGQNQTQAFSNMAVITINNATGNNQPGNNSLVTNSNQAVLQLQNQNTATNRFHQVTEFTSRRPGVNPQINLFTMPKADGNVQTQYADGIGRPLQSIAQQTTPLQKDVINAVQYDDFGRTTENFLPFSDGGTNAAHFRNNAGTQQRNFYNLRFPGEQFLYSKTVPEDDMSGEVLSQSAPGTVFTGNNLGARGESRIYMETEEVVYWYLNSSGLPVANGTVAQRFYGNRDLMIEEAFDINGRRLIRYTDLMGRMVMEKIQNVDAPASNTNGWNMTYYVYDELSQLRYVMPSTAVKAALTELGLFTSGSYTLSNGIINNLCFEFRYDILGRVVYKKVPEVAHELYVYDQLGRQVLSQDAKQRVTGQWSFIKFDAKDRPTFTGTWNAGTGVSETTIRNAAATSSDYPAINASTEVHTETYYDNYSFTGASAKPFNSALFSDIPIGTNAVTPAQSNMLNDLITGTRIRVFYPAGVTGSAWLTTVNYYDNRERVIQTHSDNILGGTDVLSTRYNFTGDVLGQHYRHANPKPNANYAVLNIIKRNVYDIDGRLLQVFQKVNNDPERQLLGFEYNELGQLTKKILGPGAGVNGTNLENLNYTYNIQGQLTGINANYARDRTAGHWWGTSLHYYDGFTQPKYDGTISGVVWRSKGRFDEANAYGFDYDVMSRLKQAYFTQNTASNTSGGSWTQDKNFTTDNLNYDENGNIINMRSQSTAFGTTRTVDDLTYSYNTNSNRLTKVQDNGSGTPASNQTPGTAGATGLKDFKDGTNTGDDYTYDANGNIITDANKNFTATYNHLDKPERIVMENNQLKDIRYVYDATGERLQKIVRHNDTVRTTTYVDGLTYLNDTTLLFFTHDGGRTRRNYKGRLVNDYFIEDHLGNTRMVLTDERDTVAYLAAFETNRDALENAVWRNRNSTRETITSTNAFFNNPNPNAQYSRLNGNDAARRKGPGLVLKVMAGDTLNITTRALYNATSVPNTMATVNDMVTSVLTGFLGAASGNATLDNKAWLQTNNGVVVNTNAMNSFITNNQNNNSNTGTTPRAYLKYLLFDEDFKLVQGFAERIDNGANTVHLYNAGGQLVVPKNGFIYVFTTNESPVDVWFDDINVIHRTGPLLQESSFYPFGMEITPLSSYAAIKVPNERDYQKNELDEEFGLELHYFDARMYDAQVGRFGGVDVNADKFTKLSPYNYAANNPYYYVDPDGRIIIALAAKIVIKAAAKAIIKKIAMKAAGKAAAKFTGSAFGKGIVAAAKYAKVTKGLGAAQKIGSVVGGVSNTIRNWDNISKGGRIDVFRGVNHFMAGSAGGQLAAIGTPLATAGGMVLGGLLNVEADFLAFDETLDDSEGFFRSFSRGALSSLAGKSAAKSFLKGMDVKVGPAWTNKWWGQGIVSGVEKGTQTVMDNYDEYGNSAYKKFGKSFYWNSFGAGFAGGFLKGAGSGLISNAQYDLNNTAGSKKYDFSLFSVGFANVGGDITKKLSLKSMNKAYKEALNQKKKVDLASFFNGFLQLSLYHTGANY